MSRPIGTAVGMPSPMTITMASRCSIGGGIRNLGAGAPASGASPWSDAADCLLAFPFIAEVPTLVNKFFWVNGSSAGSNSDMALYDADYNKVGTATGSTGGTGNSVPQATAPSGGAFTIPPGLYYCAITCNATTTNRFFRWSLATTGAGFWQSFGCWKQASTAPGSTPATATPGDITNVAFPLCGIITRSGFDA